MNEDIELVQTALKGEKKAFIKLHPDNSAQDIAIELGIF